MFRPDHNTVKTLGSGLCLALAVGCAQLGTPVNEGPALTSAEHRRPHDRADDGGQHDYGYICP